jgi:hypothetical protein
MMGPNCLRILDELLERTDLPPGAACSTWAAAWG